MVVALEQGSARGLLTGDVHAWPTAGAERLRPTLIEACRGRSIASLAGGYGHTAVIPSDGSTPHSATTPLEALRELGALKEVAFGKEHVLALTASGKLYTFGKGGWGQLGHASMNDAPSPLLVRKLDGRPIAQVAAGTLHSLALAESGDVYSWGRGFEGQLGHGDGLDEAVLSPRCIAGLRAAGRVIAIAAGAFHNAALGADGRVWVWGDGTSGQLGVGKLLTKASRPILVPGLPSCSHIACGYMHTAAAAGEHGVYCWGLGTHGQLGHSATEPNKRFALVPVKVGGALADAHVVSVACAGGTSTALDQAGHVFAWGEGLEMPTPVQHLTLAAAGRVCALASDGLETLALVETALSHTVPACAPLAGGSEVIIFGWGFYANGKWADGAEADAEEETAAPPPAEGANGAGAEEGVNGRGSIVVRFERESSAPGQPALCADVAGELLVAAEGREGAAEQGTFLRRLRATVPPLGAAAGPVSIRVSFDAGARFTAPLPAPFWAVEQPILAELEPPLLPVGGGSRGGVLVLAEAPMFESREAVALLTWAPAGAPAAVELAAPGAPSEAVAQPPAMAAAADEAAVLSSPFESAPAESAPGASLEGSSTGVGRGGPAQLRLPARYDAPSGGYFVDLSEVPLAHPLGADETEASGASPSTAPPMARSLTGTLQLALDGASFTESACALTLYAPPIALGLQPSCGPLSGGTVVSLHLAEYVSTELALVRLAAVAALPTPAVRAPVAGHAPAAEGAPEAQGTLPAGAVPSAAAALGAAADGTALSLDAAEVQREEEGDKQGAGGGGEQLAMAPADAAAAAPADAAPLVEVTVPAKMSRRNGALPGSGRGAADAGRSGGAGGGGDGSGGGSGGVLTFTIPPNALGDTPALFALELALDGRNFCPVDPSAASFCAHAELVVEKLRPAFGPAAGGTRVTVVGGPFFKGDEAMVKVHAGAVAKLVRAHYNEADGSLAFVAPPWDASDVAMSGVRSRWRPCALRCCRPAARFCQEERCDAVAPVLIAPLLLLCCRRHHAARRPPPRHHGAPHCRLHSNASLTRRRL